METNSVMTHHIEWIIDSLSKLGRGDATAHACIYLLLKSQNEGCYTSAFECGEIAWERLHSGRWNQVPLVYREAYGTCQIIFAQHHVKAGDEKEALKLLDMCLLMGGERSHSIAHQIISKLPSSKHLSSERDSAPNQRPRLKMPRMSALSPTPSDPPRHCGSCQPLQRVSRPSLEQFLTEHMNAQVPVIITDSIAHWPALCDKERSWSDLRYLKQTAGLRTVPVEIGESYMSDSWSQELMPFSSFVDRFVVGEERSVLEGGSERPRGYLAQHQLFDQVPELRRDVCVPDFCSLLRADERGAEAGGCHDATTASTEAVALNAWFGPAGTVSPMHHDPRHNLLAQVVGSKYVCLFDHELSECLYAESSGLLGNNSQVNFESPDLGAFPLFGTAGGFEGVLREGELYSTTLVALCQVSTEELFCFVLVGEAMENGATPKATGFDVNPHFWRSTPIPRAK